MYLVFCIWHTSCIAKFARQGGGYALWGVRLHDNSRRSPGPIGARHCSSFNRGRWMLPEPAVADLLRGGLVDPGNLAVVLAAGWRGRGSLCSERGRLSVISGR